MERAPAGRTFPWQGALDVFLEDLSEACTPDRQIRQAADAVTPYFTQFRMTCEGNTVGASHADEEIRESADALAEMRRLLCLRHYAPRTVRSHLGWARRFLEDLEDGRSGGPPTSEDAKALLSHRATRGRVAASSQNQAFNALLFLFRNVYEVGLEGMAVTLRAKRGRRLPVVLSVEETRAIFAELSGTCLLILEVQYGSGLRLSEPVRLRVKDIDFDARCITVRSGKGDKGRILLLPERVRPALEQHLAQVKALHEADLAAGAGVAPLPHALHRKYQNAAREWGWQFVFPSAGEPADSIHGDRSAEARHTAATQFDRARSVAWWRPTSRHAAPMWMTSRS